MYVFELDDKDWKVTASYSYWHYEHSLRDWDYLPQWEKEKIGLMPTFLEYMNVCDES